MAEIKQLEIGEYVLKEGTTIERTGKFVSVRPLIKYTNKPRCRDCKYFGDGRATKCGYKTTICLLQPKNIKDKDGQDLYYHIGSRQCACDKFVMKPTKNEKYGYFYDEDNGKFDRIWKGFFPEVTWENRPKELVVKEEQV